MLRSILGAILGYAATVVVVIAGLGLAWAILKGPGAFQGEGPAPSAAWIAMAIVFGFLAAWVGGKVAGKIGATLAVKILVGLILVLGAFSAIMADRIHEQRDPVDKPVAEMTVREAGQHARNPAWYNWLIPLVGVAGVLLGGRQKGTASEPESS